MRLRRVLVGAVAVLPLVLVGLAVPAQAAQPACGAVITQDTTLTADLGCPSTAITFGANNVTLNLAGFRIFYNGAGNCNCPGVYAPDRTGDRVVNGTVTGFATGIYLEGGGGHTISGVIARDNIGLLSGASIYGEGIQLFESNNNRIVNSQLIHNGPFSGINLYDSAGNTVQGNQVAQNNVVERNAQNTPTIQQDIGIWVISLSSAGRSSNNLIAGNQVTQNGLEGIQVSRFSGIQGPNTVRDNSVFSNGFGQVPGIRDGDGIAVFGVNNVIQNNDIQRNAGHGLSVRSIGSQPQVGNRLIANRSFFNNLGQNPAVGFDLLDQTAGCLPNVWSGNSAQVVSPPCTLNP